MSCRGLHGASDGAPAYPPLTMFKIVFLQQWYGLSDPQPEEAVRDRLSFRRFCGVPLDAETPDHSSIWRFRQTVEKLGLSEKLLAEVNRQLDARGLIVKRGTLVDATIIAAAVKRPPFEEGPVNPRDPDASFTVKNDKTYFGYKAHSGGGRGKRLHPPGGDDIGRSARQPARRSDDPGRRSGLLRRQSL